MSDYNYVRTTLRKRGHKPSQATVDDIVQAARLAAIERNFDISSAKFKGFLVIQCLRFLQKSARAKPVMQIQAAYKTHAGCTNPIDKLIVDEDLQRLNYAIRNLPMGLRDTMEMTLRGLDVHDISEIRGVKHRTVSVDICRAKDMLRDIMTQSAGVGLPPSL